MPVFRSILQLRGQGLRLSGTSGRVCKGHYVAEQLRTFLRLKQVRQATGHCTSWIYEAMRRGDFPAPIRIGSKAVAWDAADIAAWQVRRIEQSRKAAA